MEILILMEVLISNTALLVAAAI